MLKNNFIITLLILISFSQVNIVHAESLSDLYLELLNDEKDQSDRNPFKPQIEEVSVDPTTVTVQGIVVGNQKKLTLVNGRPLIVGQKVGDFVIKDILPEGVIVQSEFGENLVEIPGYVKTPLPYDQHYAITFHEAKLQDAIRLLTAVENLNIIIPESVEGVVNLAFQETTIDEALISLLRVNNLDKLKEGDIYRVGKPEDFFTETKFITKHFQLKYATAELLVPSVTPLISEKGSVTFEQSSNTLSIRDNIKLIGEIEELINTLDIERPQVHIEAKLLTARRQFSHALGLNWGFDKYNGQVQGFGNPVSSIPVATSSDGNFSGIASNPANVGLVDFTPNSGFDLLIGNLINNTDFRLQVAAAESNGDVNIISEPSITTLNNIPANIRSGVKFYVKRNSSINVGGDAGGGDNVTEITAGIELKVTPQITSEKTIKLIIEAEESQPDFGQAVDGIPAILDNVAKTTILVQSGQTAVIGGMMKIFKSNRSNRVPFISKIPLLGWLFKTKVKSNTDEELLIFITPTIVKSSYASEPPIKPVFNKVLDEEILTESTESTKDSDQNNSNKDNNKKRKSTFRR